MTAPTRGKRGSRRGNPLVAIESAEYSVLVEQALTAFSRDTGYSIDMARAAATIESKRTVWRKRLEARKAEEFSDPSLSSELDSSLV
jgi:hypothetical protein